MPMPVTGVVRHGFVKPPAFGGPLTFFADSTTAMALGEANASARQLLITMQPPYSPQVAQQLAATVRSLLSQHGSAVAVTLLQDPDQHWGRPFMAGINTVLQLMALAALLLASSQIFNTISAQMAQQTHSIGVMKALGGSTRTIAGFYLGETLLMALIALLLAVPCSAVLAYGSACYLLGWFNVDCGPFQWSDTALLAMVVGGLLAPLLAALPPVLRGARMPVQQALASYGVGGDFGSNRFDQCLERLAGHYLPTLQAAALGNVFRRKGRLVLTQLVLISAGVLFMVLMSLLSSVNLTLDNELARSRYAVRLGLTKAQDPQRIAELAH
jgi:putative ABC transport system permease protein